MLQEIQIINPTLNVIEATYGVIFNRNLVANENYNDFTVLHLLVDTWVIPEVAPNKHIISTLVLIDNTNNVVYAGVNVLIKGANNYYNQYEVYNNQSVSSSIGNILWDGPKATPPTPEPLIMVPSVHVDNIVREGGRVTITYTVDLSFNFISIDLWTDTISFGRDYEWI